MKVEVFRRGEKGKVIHTILTGATLAYVSGEYIWIDFPPPRETVRIKRDSLFSFGLIEEERSR